ncbi:NAD-dependent epimerase/dehydratase family protein [Celerinatantimonas yamalensis]|uniref:NAD(P)-dependent oxidoreductase n=1 Tax=Celerinatantimonas yamalensis TaxID=559956 RepID=A0ABW9G4V9_9GAMM
MPTIVISGVTGFLGSHLARFFIAQGHTVYGIKRRHSSLDKLKGISSAIRFIDADIDNWQEQVRRAVPEIMIHTACSYGRHGESLSSLLQTNIVFATQLLEVAIESQASCFVNADSALNPSVSSYALSKLQFKQWGERLQDKIQFINLRIEHMYGVGDDDYKFVKWLITQIANDVRSVPLTSGIQQRDFIYIEDVVSAFDIVLKHKNELPNYIEIDIASGELITVKDFINQIISAYNLMYPPSNTVLNFGAVAYRDNEMMVPNVDASYIKELGWRAKTNYKEGIKKLLEELK